MRHGAPKRVKTENFTSSYMSLAAAFQLQADPQSSDHRLEQASHPSLDLEQVSYWWNMHRRLHLHRRGNGAWFPCQRTRDDIPGMSTR